MEASSHGTDGCSRRTKISNLFWFETFLFDFLITEQLSVTLQGVNTNANCCLVAVDDTIHGLTRH